MMNMSVKLNVGDSAPDFSVEDISSEKIVLSEVLKSKDYAVLLFHRYAGCGFCQMHIAKLMKYADKIREKAEILMFFLSSKDVLLDFARGENFPFKIISDPKKEIYKLYGVGTAKNIFGFLNPNVIKHTFEFLMNIDKYKFVKNGLKGDKAQLHGCFVVTKDMKVKYSHVGKDIAESCKPEEILKNVT